MVVRSVKQKFAFRVYWFRSKLIKCQEVLVKLMRWLTDAASDNGIGTELVVGELGGCAEESLWLQQQVRTPSMGE